MTSLYSHTPEATRPSHAIENLKHLLGAHMYYPAPAPDPILQCASEIPLDRLLAVMVAQAERITALEALIDRVWWAARDWCEEQGIDDADAVESLTTRLADDSAL